MRRAGIHVSMLKGIGSPTFDRCPCMWPSSLTLSFISPQQTPWAYEYARSVDEQEVG